MATSPTTRTKSSSVMKTSANTWSEWDRLVPFGPLVQVVHPYTRFASVKGSEQIVESVSTKPWPLGHPTESTFHSMSRYVNNGGGGSLTRWSVNGEGKRFVLYTSVGDTEAALALGPKWSLNRPPEAPSTAAVSAKLRGKLKSDFNAGVALAEVSKSVDLIASSATRIAKAFFSLKTGKVRRALAILGNPKLKRLEFRDRSAIRRRYRTKKERELASHWLELQYGWLPLINDVYNAVEHAKKKPVPNPVVRAGESSAISSDDTFLWTGSDYGFDFEQRYILSGKVGRRMVIEYKIDNDYLYRLVNVGLTNPLTVAWELVPFSFVVDWFLPLGDWLNGLDATMGLSFVRGSSTWFYNVEQRVEFTPRKGVKNVDAFFGCSQTFAFKQRDNLVDFPTIQRPYLKNPISTGHAANALALLVSSFHK